MHRKQEDEITPKVESIVSNHRRLRWVSLTLGANTYYLTTGEAYALADELVDEAERIGRLGRAKQ